MSGYILGYILCAVWLAFLTAGVLSACTPDAQRRIVVDGQLFCALATQAGPLVVAVADVTGTPVVVTGMAPATVAAICGSLAAIPVVPPPDPEAAPVVAVPRSVAPAGWLLPRQDLDADRHHTGLNRT